MPAKRKPATKKTARKKPAPKPPAHIMIDVPVILSIPAPADGSTQEAVESAIDFIQQATLTLDGLPIPCRFLAAAPATRTEP